MVDGGRPGAIINIFSQTGHVGGARGNFYCATKHAMLGLNKPMAIDLAPHEVGANAIRSTLIQTPMTSPYFETVAFWA